MRRRLAAIVALVVGVATFALGVAVAGDVHATAPESGPSTWWRRVTPTATSSTALATTGSTCPPISRRAASSQSGTVEQNVDGSTDLYFGAEAPARKEHNWIETIPGKGWFPILRLYSALQPFFDRTWRPSEIEPHNAG